MDKLLVSLIVINEDVVNGKREDYVTYYLASQLNILNYKVAKILILPPEQGLIQFEIEMNIKQFDLIILVECIKSNVASKAISNICNQKLVCSKKRSVALNVCCSNGTNTLLIPEFARILESDSNYLTYPPVIYMQGMFVLKVDTYDHLKLCYETVMKPYLTNFNKNMTLKWIFRISNIDGLVVPCLLEDENVTVTKKVLENEVVVVFEASDLASLISYEAKIQAELPDSLIIHKEAMNVAELVYKCRNYCHINNAIEVSNR